MKKWTLGVVALALVIFAGGKAKAQVVFASEWMGGDDVAVQADGEKYDVGNSYVDEKQIDDISPYQNGDKDGCYDGDYGKGGKGGKGYIGSCGRGSAFFDFELQFMRYFQEGGVADVVGSPAQFDWEATPKFEAGYVGPYGLGLRLRYWDYDGAATSAAGDIIGVEAYYFDMELFQQYDLACHSCVEVSLGLRYADFTEGATLLALPGGVVGGWQGWGGTLGLEARRSICLGSLYARGRLSVLMGDAGIVNIGPGGVVPFTADGNVVTQTELGIGYEVSGCVGRALLSARFGAEWQNWANVAIADTAFGGIGNDDVLEDAGWAGIVFAVGIEI